MRFSAVIFDLDGTLVDTLADIAIATNAVLQKFKQPEHSIEAYKTLVGDGVAVLFQRAWPATKDQPTLLQAAITGFHESYEQQWHNRSRPYAGIDSLLERLQSCRLPLTVLSNKPDPFTQKCVAHFFPQVRFTVVLGQKPDFPRKPDPAGVFHIAETLKVAVERIAYIGDTNTDMETAVSAGCCAIGVSWGFRSVDELKQSGAAHIFHSPLALGDFLVAPD
jgi:phosphoglycolate phosphatase